MTPPALLSLPDLPAALEALVRQIPRGRVATYGDLATALGDVAAARWVAQRLKEPDAAVSLPTHRVVLRTGEVCLAQAALLAAEGVPFADSSHVELSCRWAEFAASFPLRQLRDWQTEQIRHADWETERTLPEVIAGVDLSYASPDLAVAAYAAVDVATGKIIAEHTTTAAVTFPYIPGYLTFRELPPLLALLDDVRRQGPLAPVILVDGSGRLHPRQAGLAVAVGVCGGCVTVGVSKHQLCGRVREDELVDGCPTIWHQDERLGVKLTTGSKRRTVFLSPGTGIDLASSLRMVQAVWRTERLPRPIARADALSRTVAKQLIVAEEPRTK
uniref:Methylated-DNA-[protein]-cysteine S-methyltransferase DNA binding domain-containing protein n=1 Tax=Schlesneria paludicola TaxID=360056 RepID=A0A7C2K315_9PLAN